MHYKLGWMMLKILKYHQNKMQIAKSVTVWQIQTYLNN